MKKLLICVLCLGAFGAATAAEPVARTKVVVNKPGDTPTDERATRRADIDYWLKNYDGGEFTSGEYRCPAPRFPSVSKANDDIDRVSNNMEAWQACHNKAVEHFNATSFATLMPADVAALLTAEEKAQSAARLQVVHDNVAETLQVRGKLVVADFSAWRDATQAWVREHNEIVKNAPTPEREHELEERRQNRVNK